MVAGLRRAGAWGEAVVRRGDEVVARLPYVAAPAVRAVDDHAAEVHSDPRSRGSRRSEGKYARRLEAEKKLMGQLIEMLPPFDLFRMCFAPTMTNWLPFYWAGFQATVCYTYRIEDLSDLDRVQQRVPGSRAAWDPQGAAQRGGRPRLPARRAASARRPDLRPPGPEAAALLRGPASARRGVRRARSATDPGRRRRRRPNPRGAVRGLGRAQPSTRS